MRTLLVLLLDNLFIEVIFVKSFFIKINYNQASIFDDLPIIFFFIFTLLKDDILKRVTEAISLEIPYIFYTNQTVISKISIANIILTLLDEFRGNTSIFSYDSFIIIMR